MSINVFKFCSGLRILGYLMIVLVAAIVAVSYYAVVVVTVGPNLLRGGLRSVVSFAIAVVFHFLLVLLIWSYYMVVFRDPGSVPENWGAMLVEESLTGSSPIASMDATTTPENRNSMISPADAVERRPAVGFCSRCQNNKPPRCHHCSVCQRCVLKMDHHCVWVVNCVGARNYKFFLLFLAYTFLETALDTLVLVPNFVKFFGSARRHSGSPGILAVTFLAFVLNLAFALSLLCFLVMHASLLSSNTTTIELYEKKRGSFRWKYDLGRRRNFEQVFGTKKLYWFFPLFSKEDLESIPALRGLDFPTEPDTEV